MQSPRHLYFFPSNFSNVNGSLLICSHQDINLIPTYSHQDTHLTPTCSHQDLGLHLQCSPVYSSVQDGISCSEEPIYAPPSFCRACLWFTDTGHMHRSCITPIWGFRQKTRFIRGFRQLTINIISVTMNVNMSPYPLHPPLLPIACRVMHCSHSSLSLCVYSASDQWDQQSAMLCRKSG